MDFSSLLERFTERFEEARCAEEDAQREQGMLVGSRYEVYTQRIQRVKGWYEGKLRGIRGEEGGTRAQDREQDRDIDVCALVGGPAGQTAGLLVHTGGDGQAEYRDDFLLPPEMLEQMDDAYWHDFLAEWASL